MSKKIIQDIYVVKKSIRMIKKSDVKDGFYKNEKKVISDKNFANNFNVENEVKKEDVNDFEYIEDKKHVSKKSLMFLWGICIFCIAILLFFVSSMFATATITITPKNKVVSLNDTYSIASDKNVDGLHYETSSITKNLSKVLKTDGEEYVEKKAVGKVVLYNNFSTSNQRLIINTRLETKDGLIYKTASSIVIPGIKTIKGVKTPGSVEVEIFADDVGDKYNMKLSDFKGDFTVFGFKGTPKYSGFYGRLSSDITGGFVGNVKKVSDDKILAGRSELKESLNSDLIKEAFAKDSDTNILFEGNYYIQCKDLDDKQDENDYTISEECSINSIYFNKSELATFIAKNKIKDFDNSEVDIIWGDTNTVVLQGTTEKFWNETALKAKFTGSARVVWSYDANKILSGIVGQNKSIISSVIEDNSGSLTEIQSKIRPLWKNTFPDNQEKIKIIDVIRDGVSNNESI